MTDLTGGPPLRPMRGWGPGYAAKDVETFLERVRLDQVTSSDVEKVRFTSTRRGPRYDERTLDDALDRIVAALRARGR